MGPLYCPCREVIITSLWPSFWSAQYDPWRVIMSGTSIIAQISMSLVCIYNDSELVRALTSKIWRRAVTKMIYYENVNFDLKWGNLRYICPIETNTFLYLMKIYMICKKLNKKTKVIQYMKKGSSEKLYFYINICTSGRVVNVWMWWVRFTEAITRRWSASLLNTFAFLVLS